MKKGDKIKVIKKMSEIIFDKKQNPIRTEFSEKVCFYDIHDPNPDKNGMIKIKHYLPNGISAIATLHMDAITEITPC